MLLCSVFHAYIFTHSPTHPLTCVVEEICGQKKPTTFAMSGCLGLLLTTDLLPSRSNLGCCRTSSFFGGHFSRFSRLCPVGWFWRRRLFRAPSIKHPESSLKIRSRRFRFGSWPCSMTSCHSRTIWWKVPWLYRLSFPLENWPLLSNLRNLSLFCFYFSRFRKVAKWPRSYYKIREMCLIFMNGL